MRKLQMLAMSVRSEGLQSLCGCLAACLMFASAGAAPVDGNWSMPALNYASTRFSPLTDITTRNVRDLKVEFTFSTGVNRGQEAAPIVVDGTMYVITPFPNYVYALDLTKPGAPTKWQFNPKAEPAALSSSGMPGCA